MRKMMNKKGFSLVELMIVVVIMGILIAVAIPLYGAITVNANNKTCATNIETIKTTAANYYASYDQSKIDLDGLKFMMDDGKIPVCPLGGVYAIQINAKGGADVYCANTEGGTTAETNKHKPDGNAATALTGTVGENGFLQAYTAVNK